MAATDARPVPRKNVAYRLTFPILDADGDLVTGAATLDSEVSIDGGAFADCTNEATEIATSSGVYYLDLTSTEMNGDTVAVIVKTGTAGAKTTTIVMYPEEAGDYRADVTHFGGTAGTFSAGRPEVNTTHWAGTAVASATVNANMTQVSGDSVAADNLETAFDDTAGPVPWMGILDQGTAQSATGTTVVLRAASAFGDNALIGATIAVHGSTQGYWQTRAITDNVLATDTVSVDTFDVTPTGTITYKIFAGAPASATNVPAVNVTQFGGVAGTFSGGRPEVNTTHAAGTAWGSGAITAGSVAASALNGKGDWNVGKTGYSLTATTGLGNQTANITGNLSGSVGSVTGAVGSVTGAVGSVTGNVGGNVVGSVGSVTAGVTVTTNNDKTGYALTAGERTSVADALLDRDMATGTDSGSATVRTVRQALRFLRNKWSISGGTLTVTKEDDTTASWTGAVTTTAGNPVSAVDPASA